MAAPNIWPSAKIRSSRQLSGSTVELTNHTHLCQHATKAAIEAREDGGGRARAGNGYGSTTPCKSAFLYLVWSVLMQTRRGVTLSLGGEWRLPPRHLPIPRTYSPSKSMNASVDTSSAIRGCPMTCHSRSSNTSDGRSTTPPSPFFVVKSNNAQTGPTTRLWSSFTVHPSTRRL